MCIRYMYYVRIGGCGVLLACPRTNAFAPATSVAGVTIVVILNNAFALPLELFEAFGLLLNESEGPLHGLRIFFAAFLVLEKRAVPHVM